MLFRSDDSNEAVDSDGDGVGDNADEFDNDANETTDSDGDGVGDNSDAFPDDANESSDFDGDGIEQLGIFRAGTWIIDSNSNGVLDQTDKVFELGVEGDLPVAGDFDGDGIDEPSVYRAKGSQLTGDETDLREAS